ncbi:GNAT family N-acetyltransferase [Subtercola boreus]|uniref:GNAT family N-acetyltransferase n=1 Tax=Subtercola boreus TaxID=120213 RepID=A0A3E0VVM2_9MICO|nr:GNAT family N-acetyltransferase [Subtercola boreus]RFA13645.1 GNAT family N-acetyltransferase [Subtercola boreus]
MPLRVRFAQARDLSAIEQIENRADQLLINQFHPDGWPAAPAGAARASQPGFLLVAELADDSVAGFAHVLETEGFCHLEQLSVTPEHARQGVGRMLVEAAKQHARMRGHAQISLRTFADVPWNAPFYATAGFIEEEPTTPFHRSLIDVEAEHGLDRYERRVHMVAHLTSHALPAVAE